MGRGDGVKIAVKMKIDFRAGLDLRKTAAGGAAFHSKDRAIEGSREVMTTFLPMCARPWVRLMEVTVFPSPAAVGVVAVTMINFPRRLNKGSESSSSLTFPLVIPMVRNILRGFRVCALPLESEEASFA